MEVKVFGSHQGCDVSREGKRERAGAIQSSFREGGGLLMSDAGRAAVEKTAGQYARLVR